MLQHTRTLQYVSYCNEARYRDRWAPMVKNFWVEVVKPFRSRALHVRYCVPEFPHSSATFNIILGFHILASPEVLQGSLGDSACPMQCSQPCPLPANRYLTGLTWFPIVLYYIK